jgi:sugar (pentulose or hexulose) kinase
VPIRTTETAEASLLGSAIVAAAGSGAYPSFAAAAAAMVRLRATFAPDPAAHREYAFWVDKYARTYAQLKELMHETAGRDTPPAS